jgi:hypothetical protein
MRWLAIDAKIASLCAARRDPHVMVILNADDGHYHHPPLGGATMAPVFNLCHHEHSARTPKAHTDGY